VSLLVGTSGFDYAHWRGPFYPPALRPGDRLAFYAREFPTLELNVTFYRMPAAAAFRTWASTVPHGFVFAVKASRYLTHIKRLRDPKGPVEFLLDRASQLGSKLGPILLQLPPDLELDPERLDRTLEAFGRTQVAVEFRHASWFVPEVEALLRARGAALCFVDRRGPRTPNWRTAGWTYLRFHGGLSLPPGCYGDRALAAWGERLREMGADERGFVYFNNDGHACAIRNARTFGRMLERLVEAAG
jgi:uncharacterized protein YecE (DUF72 family)